MKASELTARDLRIGNLVNSPIQNEIVKLVAIEQGNRPITLGKDGTSSFSGFDCLEGIPLTEEWLLKFGFEKVITDTEDAYGIDYNLEVPDICYISYSDDFSCAIYGSEYASKNSIGAVPNWNSIKYVHGLQNLYFALTGEELTIGGQDEQS